MKTRIVVRDHIAQVVSIAEDSIDTITEYKEAMDYEYFVTNDTDFIRNALLRRGVNVDLINPYILR